MWEIQGESGKALGATLRDTDTVAANMVLRLESLQPDRLTWSVTGQEADLSDLTLPELGEEVQLWRDSVRQFRGIVSALPVTVSGGNISVNVTCEGAHFWLEKTPLTQTVTDVDATSQDRATFAFAKGGLGANFTALFARATAEGLPVALGTVATLYDVPQMTVADGSFADALAELVRMVPDAVTWWDYTATVPEFNLARRGSASVLSLAYGSAPFVSATLAPRLGLETEKVTIQYAQRGEDGEIRFYEQTDGTAADGKVQVRISSGEELAEILPPDPIDSATITTVDAISSGTAVDPNAIEQILPAWVDFVARHSATAATRSLTNYDPINGNDSTWYPDGAAPKIVMDDDGAEINTANDNRWVVILDPDNPPPSWLDEVEDVQKARLIGTVRFIEGDPVGTPDWLQELIAEADVYQVQLGGSGNPVGENNDDRRLFFDLNLEILLIDREITAETLYKPLAYQFAEPPAGFAAALNAAQGFLPYEGDVVLTEQDAGGTAAVGKVLNVTGALTEWATMKALIQGVEISLADGSQVIRCGAPQRLSLSDIVTRLRFDRRDNLILL
jgi:hypothetical protein